MKKILLVLAVMAVSCMAKASYLYWQLDNSDDTTYNSVTIRGSNGSTSTPYDIQGLVWNTETEEWVVGTIDSSDVQANTTYMVDIDDTLLTEGYTYYIELLDNNNNLVSSASVKGDDFASFASGGASTDLRDLAGSEVAYWHTSASGGTMDNAPEPTSGLLLLFGAAVLGLKRKNRSRA